MALGCTQNDGVYIEPVNWLMDAVDEAFGEADKGSESVKTGRGMRSDAGCRKL